LPARALERSPLFSYREKPLIVRSGSTTPATTPAIRAATSCPALLHARTWLRCNTALAEAARFPVFSEAAHSAVEAVDDENATFRIT